MKWLTIDYIKEHLHIDFDCEDSMLELYGDAAEEAILNEMRRTEADLIEEYGKIPTPVMQATLLLVGDLYKNREMQIAGNSYNINPAFGILLKPYYNL